MSDIKEEQRGRRHKLQCVQVFQIISFVFILTTLEGPNMTVLKNKDYPVHCVETRFNKGRRKLFVKPFGSPRTILSRDPELLNRTRD